MKTVQHIVSMNDLIHFVYSFIPTLNTITTITFGDAFNERIDRINWRKLEGIRVIRFGKKFNQSLDNILWSSTLTEIHLNERHTGSIEKLIWTEGLKMLNRNAVFFTTTLLK
jgi:hypothetical protein